MKAPRLKAGGSAGEVLRPAKKKDLEKLGLPTERPADWKAVALAKLEELVRTRRGLRIFMDDCVQCGACADKCPFFLGTGDPNNMPVGRAELFRKVYRRHFTASGKLFRGLADAEELSEETLQTWYTYFYQCSECRRCAVYCPYGIDTAEVTRAAREVLASVGLAPQYVTEVVAKVYDFGNNLGIPKAAWIDSCRFLEEEMKEETGLPIRIPVDEKGADVLLVPPSADLFANTNTMIGYAKIFHAAGISWTTSTYASEAGNFGLFLTEEHLRRCAQRIVDAARELGVARIVAGECGHGWRATGTLLRDLCGPLDFLEDKNPLHIVEVTAGFLSAGRIRLDASRGRSGIVTYHDPCNVARAGGLIEEPRILLRSAVRSFVEMPADTIRERTLCCGAGGGLLADELMGLRMKGARARVEALRVTGAGTLATICAICKAQFPHVFSHYKLDVEVAGVTDLVAEALVMG
ncbi:MAG: 4Fe-4S dicluster domain-containing protein [Planctomycetota bacterium]